MLLFVFNVFIYSVVRKINPPPLSPHPQPPPSPPPQSIVHFDMGVVGHGLR